jgi:DNA-binding NarL/FixJ family response regulator
VADKLIDNDLDKLSARELSVLNLLSQGLATAAIAQNLGVSEKRVRNVLVMICDKLAVDRSEGISPRVTVINKARELGLISKD